MKIARRFLQIFGLISSNNGQQCENEEDNAESDCNPEQNLFNTTSLGINTTG